MTNLTTRQIEQAEALIEKYGFCTLETQKELAKAGFFEKVKCNLSLCVDSNDETIEVWGNSKETFVISRFTLIPMPQFHEVWEALPEKIHWYENVYYPSLDTEKGIVRYQYAGRTKVSEEIKDRNICEAACLLWLKLKENLLC